MLIIYMYVYEKQNPFIDFSVCIQNSILALETTRHEERALSQQTRA